MSDALPEEIRLLHVDDDPMFLDAVGTVLEREFDHFDVVTATDPEEGIEVLVREPIDCVVSDYDMPGSNGLDLLDAVRAERPRLPFVLFTGKGSEEIAADAFSRGASDYLQKEPGIDQLRVLANSVENLVARASAEREVERTRDWFSTLLANIPDFVFVANGDGDIEYCSPSVEPIMGNPPEALVGTNAFDYIHREDVDTARAALSRVLDHPDREVSVEFRVRRADGTWRTLDVRGRNLLDDPLIDGVVVCARDVTPETGDATRDTVRD